LRASEATLCWFRIGCIRELAFVECIELFLNSYELLRFFSIPEEEVL
jgi:hypothetical protein